MRCNILVTGASGFIGSFLVEEALKLNFKVWAGVRSTSSKKYLTDKRIHFINLNFQNPTELRSQIAGFKSTHCKWDYVIHCAGVTKCKNKAEFDQHNYEATKNLVEVLTEFNMIPRQFIYISTLSVYGPIRENNYEPIAEEDTPLPNTAYGKSKLKTEHYLKSLPDFPYVIFRPTGVYGPREKDYFLMAQSIKKHVDFSVYLKRQNLTFIYVKDLVKAIFLAIGKKVVRKSYFVSDGKVYSSNDFSNYIRKELGNPFVISFKIPLFILKTVSLCAEFCSACINKTSTLNSDKYNIMKQRNWQCDITPLVNELEFQPDYSLEQGVKETIDWYKKEGWL